MRSGACTVQQTLTAEAASVLKHSLSLARRRGHAQVTPLHVAATLLSSRTSLLRRACLKSQPHHHQTSHPLQCRALELCFNVALHRLPTTPSPLLHGQPSLSNALIAALKRAQAHQRRGCIEQQQQQPLLTIKVELEQLVISILDDPSVSRVMREAGFSSTAVKNNLEDFSASSVFQCYSTSGGVFSSPCSPSPTDATQREIINPTTFWQNHLLACTSERNPILLSPQKKVLPINHLTDSASSVKEDIKLVFEVLLSKKRKNTVIVGDCTSITEGVVGELIGRLERGEVPVELKQTQFIKFQFAPVSLRFMKRDDVDMNMSELKRKMDSLGDGGGAIIYTGDLKWTVEDQFVNGEVSGYSPVDHLVSEIGKLLSDYSNRSAKVWLMATSTYQTYMRCHLRQPPLENQWALQAVSVPSGGLGLSLHASSFHDSRIAISGNTFQQLEAKPLISTSKEEQDKFTCCPECTSNYEKEAQVVKSGQQRHLPPWLQKQGINSNQTEELVELRKKWHRFCQSLHQQGRHNQSHFVPTMCNNQSPVGKSSYSYVSSYPYWTSQNFIFPDSNPVSFMDSSFKVNQSSNGVPKFRRQQSCTIEFNFGTGAQKHLTGEPSLDPLRSSEGKEVKITLALGNSLFSDSGKLDKRKGGLYKLLQENVPWQSESIPFILQALGESESSKKPTWILIEGNDTVGKRRLALSIAESFCGSADFLLCMNTRKQENADTTCCEMLAQALRRQEKLVVLVEEVECADTQFLKFLADGLETGYFGGKRAGDAGQAQTIIILTKGGSLGHEDGKMDRPSLIQITLKVQNTQKASLEMPNMDHKRKKAEWINNTSGKTKVPRIDGKEDESYSLSTQKGTKKKEFSKQSSFNKLDLNIKANEDDDQSEEDKPGEFSPMSSDLTRETTSDPLTPRGFLELIKNRFVFDRNKADDQDKEMAEVLLSKFKTCLEEVFGGEKVVGFSMEERVLEELIEGSGSFVSSLFEKWLKDVFQTSLQTVNIGGGNGNGNGNGIEVRLCFGGRKYKVLEEDGFMGTCLPRKIQVSFMD